MLSGSFTMTKQNNIYSHHLHPNRHVFNQVECCHSKEKRIFLLLLPRRATWHLAQINESCTHCLPPLGWQRITTAIEFTVYVGFSCVSV